MASVTSLSDSVQQHLASALTATRPEAAGADPLLRRTRPGGLPGQRHPRPGQEGQGEPARSWRPRSSPHIVTGDLIKDVEVSGPGFLTSRSATGRSPGTSPRGTRTTPAASASRTPSTPAPR
ncbi:hypothetical protein LV779_30800 [Streptomyces thinghirensis]|nr:hypothetical protein [Streptomyces thinghirensis]